MVSEWLGFGLGVVAVWLVLGRTFFDELGDCVLIDVEQYADLFQPHFARSEFRSQVVGSGYKKLNFRF